MKAVRVHAFGPIGQALYEDAPDPVPADGEVVVEMDAIDVNFADILFIEGRYQRKPTLPFSPGLCGVGHVAELGSGVTNLSLGDRVLVVPEQGTYAEKLCLPAQWCLPVPMDIPAPDAAALGLVYQTAYFALTDHGQIGPETSVLVLGASGGVGMAAVQLARALGAGPVIAAARGADGMAFAAHLGADHVIDASDTNLRTSLATQVKAATAGHGADIVIDPVGGTFSEAALRAMAWRGRLVVVGFAAGEVPSFSGGYLLVKNISVSGIQWTDYRDREPARIHAAQKYIFELFTANRVAPEIHRTVPLSQFATALCELQCGATRGKTILIPEKAGA